MKQLPATAWWARWHRWRDIDDARRWWPQRRTDIPPPLLFSQMQHPDAPYAWEDRLAVESFEDRVVRALDAAAAMDRLPHRSRQALWLSALGYRGYEIARALGISESLVSRDIKAGRGRLRV